MGTVQDYRTGQAWANVASAAWTGVPTSSAWPINQGHLQMKNQSSPIQPKRVQSAHSPVSMPSPSPTSFHWSNSWDPVVIVPNPAMIKKAASVSSSPANTSPLVNQVGKDPKKYVNSNPMEPMGLAPALANPFMMAPPNPHSMISFEMAAQAAYPIGAYPVLHAEAMPVPVDDDENDDEDEDEEYSEDGIGLKTGKKKKTAEEKAIIEEELSKQNLYKTELCRSFCETGVCRYGHKCQFAHGEHEIRPVLRHPKYKTEICKTFSNTGTCPYGNRCRFIHPGMTWAQNWDENGNPQEILVAIEQLNLSSSPPHPQSVPMGMMPQQIPPQIQPGGYPAAAGMIKAPVQVGRFPNGYPATAQFNGQYPAPVQVDQLKERESDIKALVDDDAESDLKPRLAFFQNLTVL